MIPARRRRCRAGRGVPGRDLAAAALPAARPELRPGLRRTAHGPRGRAEDRTASPGGVPRRFEAYFNDSFGLRDQLIRWNNLAKVSLLGVSTSSRVMIGKRGWLFYTCRGGRRRPAAQPPADARGARAVGAGLEERRDWLARRGIRYLVMFAPNKHTIYPEFIPVAYDRVTPRPGMSSSTITCASTPTSSCSTSASRCCRRSRRRRLYYRRDTHWNDRGAFVAYQTIIAALSRWYPEPPAEAPVGLQTSPVGQTQPRPVADARPGRRDARQGLHPASRSSPAGPSGGPGAADDLQLDPREVARGDGMRRRDAPRAVKSSATPSRPP